MQTPSCGTQCIFNMNHFGSYALERREITKRKRKPEVHNRNHRQIETTEVLPISLSTGHTCLSTSTSRSLASDELRSGITSEIDLLTLGVDGRPRAHKVCRWLYSARPVKFCAELQVTLKDMRGYLHVSCVPPTLECMRVSIGYSKGFDLPLVAF